jgi:hypothetical protein
MDLREPFPLRSFLGLSLLGVGCGFLGALSGAKLASSLAQPPVVSIPEIALEPTVEPIAVSTASTVHTTALPAPSNQVGMVIAVDGESWMVLDVDPTPIETGRTRLESADYPSATVAMIHHAPAAVRAWRGQAVIVDASCTDTLHDFAVIHQISGDPVYADDGDNAATATWTIDAIAAHGVGVVAAKLDHCTGTYARAASAQQIVAYKAIDLAAGDNDVALASDDLMHSGTAREAKQELLAQMAASRDVTTVFEKVTELTSNAAIDPRTGTKWIAVHAHTDFECGGPQVNFWGLYRVEGDHVVPVRHARLESLAQITSLLDLDGDGIPEILGGGWISPTNAIYDLEEHTLATYDVPFFGCPC